MYVGMSGIIVGYMVINVGKMGIYMGIYIMGIYNSVVGAITRKICVHFVEERNRIYMMGIQGTYRGHTGDI